MPPDTFHPTAQELAGLRGGLRSGDPFTRRRCAALLALARGLSTAEAAQEAGYTHQAVYNVAAAFRAEGLGCLKQKRRGPQGDTAWPPERDADLLGLLRQSPREHGLARDWWTVRALAEAAIALGWCGRVFSDSTIQTALRRQGVDWAEARWWAAQHRGGTLPEVCRGHRADPAAPLGEAEAALKELREASGDKDAFAELERALQRLKGAVEAPAQPAEP